MILLKLILTVEYKLIATHPLGHLLTRFKYMIVGIFHDKHKLLSTFNESWMPNPTQEKFSFLSFPTEWIKGRICICLILVKLFFYVWFSSAYVMLAGYVVYEVEKRDISTHAELRIGKSVYLQVKIKISNWNRWWLSEKKKRKVAFTCWFIRVKTLIVLCGPNCNS